MGFSYQVLSNEKDMMDDGLLVPPNADGMTCINMLNDRVILIRNHELGHVPKLSVFLNNNCYGKNYKKYKKKNAEKFYDIKNTKTHCFGGTTSIVYNTKTEKVEKQYLSLAGTLVNCSGGITPWNTWITCEETVIKNGRGITKDHGYNFEVIPSIIPNLTKAIPLKDMGRFRHEGIAFDKKGYIYQTEDRPDGLFYRFTPKSNKKLYKGGKLQILSFKDWRGIETNNWKNDNIKLGNKYKVRWIDIDDVNSPNDDLRYRGRDIGGALFARGEGIFSYENIIYFTATIGGKNKTGQIWKYIADTHTNEGSIELFYESEDANVLNMPDNIILSPHGDIILCEDARGRDRLVCIRKNGSVYYLANNALNNQEFAGITFSPDGKILFVNIYNPTMTLAIKGPWLEL